MNKTGKYILATIGALLAYNLLRGQSAPGGTDADYSYLGGDCNTPRGIRNNNPGNLKVSSNSWLGKVPYEQNQDFDCRTGQVTRTFEQFTSYKYGIRALVKLLVNYMEQKRLTTISQIINRYAPGTENDPSSYINFVSNYTGISPHSPLSPSRETLLLLSKAIAKNENGVEAISSGEFYAVWNEFFEGGISGYGYSKKKTAIGAIIDPNDLAEYTTLCRDGSYSRSTAPNACTYHGGVQQYSANPPGAGRLIEAHPSAVYLIPLSEISFDRELFQNREEEYSEESVQRIIAAVQEGTFRFEVFDPILLWKNPNGHLIVLSGHSRTEAFTRLSEMGYEDFSRIPAKIIEVSLAQARKIALESNTLATREKDSERAAYYRALRDQGVDPAEAEEMAKQNEGSNARRIIAYSYLNPGGKAMTTLKALEGRDDTSQENIKNVANWIGTARMRFPELSNLHEDEIYDWLIGGAFGRQYTNMRDFLQKIQSVILQRSEFGRFDPERLLNLANVAVPTYGEQAYNEQRSELMARIRDIDKQYKDWIKRLNAEEASQADRERILRPLEMQLRTARQKLLDFEQKATRPGEAARQELNLFAMAGIVRSQPPGRYECADGYFTTASGPGRCSWHGGSIVVQEKNTGPASPEYRILQAFERNKKRIFHSKRGKR